MVSAPEEFGPFAAGPLSPARLLRGNYRCVARFSEQVLKRTYVIDPSTGSLVMPVPADGPDAPSNDELDALVVFIPDEGEGSLQLLCEASDIDPNTHEAPDRHLIYHGPARERRWLRLAIQSARRENQVFEAALVTAPNPLRSAEPALCKKANARPDDLLAACRKRLRPGLDRAVMVGIDPLGVDIRARFGPERVDFQHPATTQQLAEQALIELLSPSPDTPAGSTP